jgi:hypothetical protein
LISLILGRRELGKSTLALYIARKTPTRIIFDPRAMFHTSPDIFRDDLFLSGRAGVEENLELALDTRSEIIVAPPYHVIETFNSMCEILARWVEENPREELTLIVDEARFVETTSEINPFFDWLLRCTLRSQVNIVFTAHRPADIAVDIRSIADFWIMFHTTQEHDLKVIAERCGSEVSEMVHELKPGEVVIWNDSRATFRKETDRVKWFVPMTTPAAQTEEVSK